MPCRWGECNEGILLLPEVESRRKGGGASGRTHEGQIIDNEIELETISIIRGDRSHLYMKTEMVKDSIVAAAAEARKGRVYAESWFAMECQQRK